MKIAMVSHEYPPFQGGGIGTYATLMSRLLSERGHEVHVITNLSPSAKDPEHQKLYSQNDRLHIHRIRGIDDAWGPPAGADALEIRLHREWSPYLAYSHRVAECLRKVHNQFGLDIVEFPECAAEGYCPIHLRRLGLEFVDLPMTVTLHSPIEDIYRCNQYPRQNLGFQRRSALEESTILEADGINSPSARLLTMVQDRLNLDQDSARPCDVIRLPVDIKSIGHAQAPGGIKKKFLVVGRVEPRKGVIDLVDAAAPLLQQDPQITIEFLGRVCDAGICPGSMDDCLRSRVADSARDQLVFHGQITQDQLAAHLSSCTACVFASRWDNYPVACLEALGAGVCCIVSDGVGTSEMLTDREDALVYPSSDIDALRSNLRWAIDHPETRAEIGIRAKERAGNIADHTTAVDARVAHYDRVIRHASDHTHPSIPQERIIAWSGSPDQTTEESIQKSALHANARLVDPDSTSAIYALEVPAGDTLALDAMDTMLRVLENTPDSGRVTPWTRPASTGGPMHAGFDFQLPLELISDTRGRTVLTRSCAIAELNHAQVGFPPIIERLDRDLSMHTNGWRGLCVPLWLSSATGRSMGTETHGADPDRSALALEHLVARHPEIFARHGAAIWLYSESNAQIYMRPWNADPDFRGAVTHATKTLLKKRLPRFSAWARRSMLRLKS